MLPKSKGILPGLSRRKPVHAPVADLALAAAGDRLYFGSRDGHLYCISTQGKLLRKWDAHAPIMTSPAVGGGHVYFSTAAGRLHCLRAETLERVPREPEPTEP